MHKSQEFKMNQLAPPLSFFQIKMEKFPTLHILQPTNLDNGFESELYHEQIIITHLRK